MTKVKNVGENLSQVEYLYFQIFFIFQNRIFTPCHKWRHIRYMWLFGNNGK